MPRWRDLPDELDPRVEELARRLRRLVDHAGLGVATLADRTGYGVAAWERYLDGRLLAPKGAVIALAEVAGADPAPLIPLWESAERAWSRAELRDDAASEAVRLSRARTPTITRHPVPERPPPAHATAPVPPPRRPGAVVFLVGAVGVVGVAVGAFLLTHADADSPAKGRTVAASSSPSPTPGAPLPPGVLCFGAACTGGDAEKVGCGGELAATARSVTVGAVLLEVRYSRTCGAAWGRITPAVAGDEVRVTAGAIRYTGRVTAAGETVAYTPMVAVKNPAEIRACAVLASGHEGCTPQ
ncbi:helix-turn-helix domain-containing protein [Streptomyces sp. NPDC102395]|uniref:helix-turn-helix domain-containing protein n=1 Tax=Streptomyces sp. NPDC102395 TaxID=3366168 RepID=UPI0037F6276D